MALPVTLYRSVGGRVATQKAYSQLVKQAALMDGWHETQLAAIAADRTPAAVMTADESDAEPTRAELEQKATELGIKFDGRTADKTLAAKIQEAI